MNLRDKTVLVTRAKAQAEEFAGLIEGAGGKVVFFPTIEIAPPESWVDCDSAIRRIQLYDIFLFTSTNAVENFFDRVLAIDGRSLSTVRQKNVYAVGEKTRKALESRGCRVNDIPEKYTAQELGNLVQRMEIRKKRFLLPRGNLGSRALPKLLRQSGAIVDEVVVYRTQKPQTAAIDDLQGRLKRKEIDVATFFSPSSVRNFVELIPSPLLNALTVAVIGKVTKRTAEQLGLRVDVVPLTSTSEALVAALGGFFQNNPVRVV